MPKLIHAKVLMTKISLSSSPSKLPIRKRLKFYFPSSFILECSFRQKRVLNFLQVRLCRERLLLTLEPIMYNCELAGLLSDAEAQVCVRAWKPAHGLWPDGVSTQGAHRIPPSLSP
jgi:hypothetical protein